ncbi:MAG: hypothetical protein WBP56_18885 [Polyangia bacterium]
MHLDVRIPIGLLFVVFGAILTVFGLFSDPAIYQSHSLGLNVNFAWGLVQIAFGAVMLGLAFRGRKAKTQIPGGTTHLE